MHEELADGTGAATSATGSVSDLVTLDSFVPLGSTVLTMFGNDYRSTPDGMSDYVPLFNNRFPIFDTFGTDPAPAASDSATLFGSDYADPGWLADLGMF